MTGRGDRFRRLAPSGERGDATQTADLFEHYGIALRPGPAADAPLPAVEARPCRRCGWFLAIRRDAEACPLCAEPSPTPA